MGSDCAVGVETDGNFGVVCLDAGKIFCSTCVCVCVCACVCVCVCVHMQCIQEIVLWMGAMVFKF